MSQRGAGSWGDSSRTSQVKKDTKERSRKPGQNVGDGEGMKQSGTSRNFPALRDCKCAYTFLPGKKSCRAPHVHEKGEQEGNHVEDHENRMDLRKTGPEN